MINLNNLQVNEIITKYSYNQILKQLDSYEIKITKLEGNEIEILTRGIISDMTNKRSFEDKVMDFMSEVTLFIKEQREFNNKQIEFNNKIENDIKIMKNDINDIKSRLDVIESLPTIKKELKNL